MGHFPRETPKNSLASLIVVLPFTSRVNEAPCLFHLFRVSRVPPGLFKAYPRNENHNPQHVRTCFFLYFDFVVCTTTTTSFRDLSALVSVEPFSFP